jgi:hypothetical protein
MALLSYEIKVNNDLEGRHAHILRSDHKIDGILLSRQSRRLGKIDSDLSTQCASIGRPGKRMSGVDH